jgi:putative transposase
MLQTLTRTICCKLAMDDQETLILAATQRAFNAAAAWVARVCWDEGLTNTNTAHHRVYGQTRERFGLGAQLAVCARMKAVEAIKAVKAKQRETCPVFGPRGSVRYDARSYTLLGHERVSLNTLEGRVTCRLVLGERQLALLGEAAWAIGGADLVWRRGTYYLHISQSREAPDPSSAPPAGGALGVDLGIVNLATDSEGQHFTGAHIHVARTRYHAHRQRLQACGTRSAKQRQAAPSSACAWWQAGRLASKRTPTTVSARPWSRKPSWRARHSPSKTSAGFERGQRFGAHTATHGIPGPSFSSASS